MRLTHSPALRGLAVFGAGAVLLGSAMLAGAQAANASAPSPAKAHAATAMDDQAMPAGSISMPHQQVLRDEGNNGDDGMDQDRYGDRDGHHKKCHHGKRDAEENWGDRDGRDGHHKKCRHHKRDSEDAMGADQDSAAQDGDDDGMGPDGDRDGHHHKKCHHRKRDSEGDDGGIFDEKGDHGHHHKKCHHHRHPWGDVDSGEGGMAMASAAEQSPATSISLGLVSAGLLGSGVWMVRRTRRFGAVK